MGIFDTPENADVYANTVHNRGADADVIKKWKK